MVANTFHIAIPGWDDSRDGSSDNESTDCFQEEPFPSASAAESAAEEEQMVEIDISSGEQEDAFWTLLTEMGIEVSDFSNGDDDDREEFEDVENYMETCMPSSNNAARPATGEAYSLNTKLRSSCVAHLLQLVIKDGLSALKVLSFYKSVEYFVSGF